jgi:hypothetical protein
VVYLSRQTYLQMRVASKEMLGLAWARTGSIPITAIRVLGLVVSRGCCTLWMAGLSMSFTGAGPLTRVLRLELVSLAPRSSWGLVLLLRHMMCAVLSSSLAGNSIIFFGSLSKVHESW